MDELLKALKALLALAPDDATKGKLVDLIHENARQEIWRPIADKGFLAAKTEFKTKLDTAEGEVLTLTGQIQEKDAKIREYEQHAPGSKEVIAGLNTKIQTLEKKVTDDRAALINKNKVALKKRDLADFRRELVEGGLKPRLAEAEVLLFDARSEYIDGEGTDADPVLRVYTSATTKVPITVPTDGNLIHAVAQDVIKAAAPEDRTSNVDAGGGVRGHEGAGGGASANEYDKIRKDAEERNKKLADGAKPDIVGVFRGGGQGTAAGVGAGRQ